MILLINNTKSKSLSWVWSRSMYKSLSRKIGNDIN